MVGDIRGRAQEQSCNGYLYTLLSLNVEWEIA